MFTRQNEKKIPSIVSGTYTQNGDPYVWIKPTGRATGGSSTRHKIVSHAMLGTPLDQVVNDFSY